MNQDGPKHMDITLTKAKFDELTADLVEATVGPVKTAMQDAGLKAGDFDKVLLVGGSTRIPAVQEAVKKLTGKDPFKGINPDECVALGASIQGGKLAGDEGAGSILLLDVTPLSLSIETMGGVATRLIERNTTIPTKKQQIFSTAADSQTAVDIVVVQGERPLARDNKQIGNFKLDGIMPAPRGVPQIEVAFDIDANGIVQVSAKDLGTGKEQKITITASTNLSDDEIDKAVKDAEMYAEQDKKRKEIIDIKNDAEAMIFQTDKLLKDMDEKLEEADKERIKEELERLRELNDAATVDAMSEGEADDLKSATESLTNVFYELSAKIYEQAGGGEGMPDMEGFDPQAPPPDGDIIDGESEEV